MRAFPSRLAAAWLGAALLASACTTPPPPLENPPPGSSYRLGSGDTVVVTVFGDPTLGGRYRVDDTGRISVPLAGPVEVGGRSLRDAEGAIVQRMRSEGVMTDPRISLNIEEYRAVYVTGEVARGGGFEFTPGMTAYQAVALAGGYSVRAKRDEILVTRAGGDGMPRLARGDTVLQAGDIVTSPERWF